MKKISFSLLCLLCFSLLACSQGGVQSKKFRKSKPAESSEQSRSQEARDADGNIDKNEEKGQKPPIPPQNPPIPPTVSIDEKSLVSVNHLNVENSLFRGTCSEEGHPVKIEVKAALHPSKSIEKQPTCQQGKWTTSINLMPLASGILSIHAYHTSSQQKNPPPSHGARAQASVTKDPIVTILSVTPKTLPEETSYVIRGTCSERNREVTVTVSIHGKSKAPVFQPTCDASGQWLTEVGVTDLPAGSVLLTAHHESSEGQQAQPHSETHTKDPTVSISIDSSRSQEMKEGTSLLNLTGFCSEEGLPVFLSVGAEEMLSSQSHCKQGSWKKEINITSIPAGSFTITALHHSGAGMSPIQIQTQPQDQPQDQPLLSRLLHSQTDSLGGLQVQAQQAQPQAQQAQPPRQQAQPQGQQPPQQAQQDTPNIAVKTAATVSITHTKTATISMTGSFPNEDNTQITLNGLCSEKEQAIDVQLTQGNLYSKPLSENPAPVCNQGQWIATVDVTRMEAGSVDFAVALLSSDKSLLDSQPKKLDEVQGILFKGTPTLKLTLNRLIERSHKTFLLLEGECSEKDREVTIQVTRSQQAQAQAQTQTQAQTQAQATADGAKGANGAKGTNDKDSPSSTRVPTKQPTCSADDFISGTWVTSVDVTSLPVGPFLLTVRHTSDSEYSNQEVVLNHQANKTKPSVSIATETPTPVPEESPNHFRIHGACSEPNREVTVQIGGIAPSPQPTCSERGTWEAFVDMSGHSLLGAIPIIADHSSSSPSSPSSPSLPPTSSQPANPLNPAKSANPANPNPANPLNPLNPADQLNAQAPATEQPTQVFTRRAQVFWIHESCPTDFVPVPPSYTPTAVSDSLYYFCVAKYEMKKDEVSGQAISQAAGTPWVNIERNAAIEACQAMGTKNRDGDGDGDSDGNGNGNGGNIPADADMKASKYDLISNAEWVTIALNIEKTGSNWEKGDQGAGAVNQGHAHERIYYSNGSYRGYYKGANRALPANEDDNMACEGLPLPPDYPCDASTWSLFRRTHALRSGEVLWDLSGNISEWVKDDIDTIHNYEQDIYIASMTDPTLKARFGAPQGDYSLSIYNRYHHYRMGLGIALLVPNAGAIIRSGFWQTGFSAGVFGFSIRNAKDVSYTEEQPGSDKVGFRCVYHP